MKSVNTKHSTAILELEKAFDFFNKEYFSGKLTPCIITIQSMGRKQARGWYWKNGWMNKKEEKGRLPELNISAEIIAQDYQPFYTLLHEMVHHRNADMGVEDCSRNGRYHNKIFKSSAELVGFNVEKHRSHGWAVTNPSIELTKYVEGLSLDLNAFSFFRGMEAKKENKAKKLIKWSCGCTSVWCESSKEVQAKCIECDNNFVIAPPKDES